MKAVNSRSARNKPEVVRTAYSRSLVGSSVPPRQRIFPLRPKLATSRPVTVGDGYQKLKNRLISPVFLQVSLMNCSSSPHSSITVGVHPFSFREGLSISCFGYRAGWSISFARDPTESRSSRMSLVQVNFSDLLNPETIRDNPYKPFKHALELTLKSD
jgi:hypothetical protein